MTSKAKQPENLPTAKERLARLHAEIERVKQEQVERKEQVESVQSQYIDVVAGLADYSDERAKALLAQVTEQRAELGHLENRQIALEGQIPAFEIEVEREELAAEIAAFPARVKAQEKTRKAWRELAGEIREKMPPIVQAYKRTNRALQEAADKIRYLEYTTDSEKAELPPASYINPKSSQELEKLICSNDPTAGSLFAVSSWKEALDKRQTAEQRERAVAATEKR
jgi:chromosome segregation ATPase